MTDGRHEAAPVTLRDRLLQWWQRVWAQLAYRAKAFLAGIGATVAGEVVILLTTAAFQDQVAGLVPPAWAWAVPPLLGAIAGSITHQVANGPKPDDAPAAAEEDAQNAGR